MTKRSGDHKLQRERRKQAVAAREADRDHVPAQTWTGRTWVRKVA